MVLLLHGRLDLVQRINRLRAALSGMATVGCPLAGNVARKRATYTIHWATVHCAPPYLTPAALSVASM